MQRLYLDHIKEGMKSLYYFKTKVLEFLQIVDHYLDVKTIMAKVKDIPDNHIKEQNEVFFK